MNFSDALKMIISGALGTTGFALLYRINKKRLVSVTIGGGLTCLVVCGLLLAAFK